MCNISKQQFKELYQFVDKKYEKLEKCFKAMKYNQVLVIEALALERMWTLFTESIIESGFPSDIISIILQVNEQRMQMVWESVKTGKASSGDYKKFWELQDYLNEQLWDNGIYELEGCTFVFDSTITNEAWCFFKRSDHDVSCCAEVIVNILELLINQLYDQSEEGGLDLAKHNSAGYGDFMFKEHPLLKNELMRIDADIELAKGYPENMDEILRKKEEYHKLNICKV